MEHPQIWSSGHNAIGPRVPPKLLYDVNGKSSPLTTFCAIFTRGKPVQLKIASVLPNHIPIRL